MISPLKSQFMPKLKLIFFHVTFRPTTENLSEFKIVTQHTIPNREQFNYK